MKLENKKKLTPKHSAKTRVAGQVPHSAGQAPHSAGQAPHSAGQASRTSQEGLASPPKRGEKQGERDSSNKIERPPIVVVLGHVDHGKTSLLDQIRKSHVVEKESGGITQHIGAYEVECHGKKITFIDTPGHEAFSAMRSRGAKVADIAILVVAADEGVKVQTKEAISHIKKAEIPMIVAINKTDKSEADPERIKRELTKEDVLVESVAGKIPSVSISAKTGKGVPELLELILLVAEMENLKGDIEKPAEGVVIESYLDSFRGPTATLLLLDGILKTGDIIATNSVLGKAKSLNNFQGAPIEKALPSTPVIILGFEETPAVGEEFKVFGNTESAQNYIKKPERIIREAEPAKPEEGKKILNLILKVDVWGSIEALEETLKGIPQEKIGLKIMKSEVGDINESDVKSAKSGRARIIGFRVKVNPAVKSLAEREKIRIMTFEIIYELAQGVRTIMEDLVKPEVVRTDLGKMRVLSIFLTEKNRQIVGGKVTEGQIKKGASIEIFRQEEPVGRGRIINLQRNKKEAEEVQKGDECGILYEGDTRIEEGDVLTVYTEGRIKEDL